MVFSVRILEDDQVQEHSNSEYNEVCTGKHLSDSFPVQNCLKRDDLSPLLFSFALEYAIRKGEEKWVGLKINGTHQLLTYADDVNPLRDDIHTKKNHRNFNWCW
jgi:hypothetical protein